MAHNPGDDKTEPTLELPSLKLPGLRRRRKATPEHPGPEPATVEDTTPPDVPADEAPPTSDPDLPEPPAAAGSDPAPAAETAPDTEPATHPEPARAAEPRRATRTAPTIPGRAAALLTGLVVGLAGAAATYAAMEGCEEVRGVSTCGGGPGFFILVAIVVLMVLLGSVVLKALRVADTASTSFLAVGIVTVVVMLTLLDHIYSPWMFVVVPALTGAAYVLSHWVTTRFEHEDTGRRDWT